MPWIALAGLAGGVALARLAFSTAKRVNQELDAARMRRMADAEPRTELPTLRRDPASGAYRPS